MTCDLFINGVEIKYVPKYALDHEFIVFRSIWDDNYFYGAYDDYGKAMEVACEIDGYVTSIPDFE